MKKSFIAAVLALIGGLSQANVVTFDNDLFGPQLNGFQSLDSDEISFSDSEGEDLFLIPFDETSGSPALGVLFDGLYDDFSDFPDSSFLVITPKEGTRLIAISIAFGNDDPFATQPGDYAQIRGYRNGRLVESRNVVMNRNDLADQRIGLISPGGVDRVELEYFTTPTPLFDEFGTVFTSLTEVVDDVAYFVR